jgi:hypothetical protein
VLVSAGADVRFKRKDKKHDIAIDIATPRGHIAVANYLIRTIA